MRQTPRPARNRRARNKVHAPNRLPEAGSRQEAAKPRGQRRAGPSAPTPEVQSAAASVPSPVPEEASVVAEEGAAAAAGAAVVGDQISTSNTTSSFSATSTM